MSEEELLRVGAAAHKQFVQDCAEMDHAWADGRLHEWLQEKLADERRASGLDTASADDA